MNTSSEPENVSVLQDLIRLRYETRMQKSDAATRTFQIMDRAISLLFSAERRQGDMRKALEIAESNLVRIDGEWGTCRTFEQMIRDGDEEALVIHSAIGQMFAETPEATEACDTHADDEK